MTNEEKKIDFEKKIWDSVRKDMQEKKYSLSHPDSIKRYIKHSNDGREIFGMLGGIGITIFLYAFLSDYTIGLAIIGLAFFMVSLHFIYRLRTTERKLLDVLKK